MSIDFDQLKVKINDLLGEGEYVSFVFGEGNGVSHAALGLQGYGFVIVSDVKINACITADQYRLFMFFNGHYCAATGDHLVIVSNKSVVFCEGQQKSVSGCADTPFLAVGKLYAVDLKKDLAVNAEVVFAVVFEIQIRGTERDGGGVWVCGFVGFFFCLRRCLRIFIKESA